MAGDRAFEEIVREHAPLITRIASTYERRPALIEELSQEILLALHRALPGFRAEASLRTFIARIAHNVGVDHVRKATRRPREAPDEALAQTPDDGDGPDRQAERAIARDRLLAAVRRLPVASRQVVSLHLEGFEGVEIADALGLSAGNVRVRLHRARDALKQIMEADR
ncbi:MAG: sigma-70 family RNA polymerase sigma factor [Litorimonas sp.]